MKFIFKDLALARHIRTGIVIGSLMMVGAQGGGALAQSDPTRALTLERSAAVRPQLEALPLAPGGGLFRASVDTREETQQGTSTRALRSRSVAINGQYLTALIQGRDARIDTQSQIVNAPQTFALNLFDNLSVRIVRLEALKNERGHTVIKGAVASPGGGSATLVIDGADVTAHLALPGRSVNVIPLGGGRHRITEAGQSARSPGHDDAVRPPHQRDRERSQGTFRSFEKPQATAVLDLLIVYTPNALVQVPDIHAAISLIMSHLNETLTNSQIDAQARLVGVDQVNFSEGAKDSSVILRDATDGVGDFTRIAQLRAAVKADLVMVLADWSDDPSCGRGWLNDDIDGPSSPQASAKYGVNVVSVSDGGVCLPGTSTHEVGHNLGAEHDRYVLDDDVAGPTKYNYGYIDLTGKFMDVMAYSDQCDDNNISCVELPYFSHPNILYNGRPLGVSASQPAAAHNARRVGEIVPLAAQFSDFLTAPSQPVLAVVTSGAGTVTSATGGINCGYVCSQTLSAGTSVSLTPVAEPGWKFTAWSGACSGTGACVVNVTASQSVTATFVQAVRIGTVFSSASQTGSQSFIRVFNGGSTAGTISATLADYATGVVLGRWTSSSIPAGAAPQITIATMESVLSAGINKPAYYSVSVEPGTISGGLQHILYRPADGTLTNLSTCDSGVTASPTQVANVHSSLFDTGFPSSIVVAQTARANYRGTDASADDAVVTLGIFNAANGVRLGTYITDTVPRDGQLIIPVSAIETEADIAPGNVLHYVVKVESDFSGFIQHLVNNKQAGVVSDMTTTCSFDEVAESFDTVAVVEPGPVFSSASQSGSQSFLRFFNRGSTAGTVNVTLANASTGSVLTSWTSPSIPAGAAPQYQISQMESGITGTKPQHYTAVIQSQIDGVTQHVFYRPTDGTLTNASTCDAGVISRGGELVNVHSSLFDQGFPSSIAVNNLSTVPGTASLGIYDASTGTKRGTYTTAVIPADGQVILSMGAIEASVGAPGGTLHYVVKLEGSFNGFLQHLVNNIQRGVITDMSTTCRLPARSIRYAACTFQQSCAMNTSGNAVAGQIKTDGTEDVYRVSLNAGQAYTIDVKAQDSSVGTLYAPYLQIYAPGVRFEAQSTSGGTGREVRYTYTPSSTADYFLRIGGLTYFDGDGNVTRHPTGTYTVTVR